MSAEGARYLKILFSFNARSLSQLTAEAVKGPPDALNRIGLATLATLIPVKKLLTDLSGQVWQTHHCDGFRTVNSKHPAARGDPVRAWRRTGAVAHGSRHSELLRSADR
jgi:hypothetical protein